MALMVLEQYIEKVGFDTFEANVDKQLVILMKEKPDFIYPDANGREGYLCHYSSGPTSDPEKCSGCIFGQAFQRLGIVTENLRGSIYSILRPYGSVPNWEDIQTLQDRGVAWGELLPYVRKRGMRMTTLR